MGDKRKIGKAERSKYEAIGGGKVRCLRCTWTGSGNAFARFKHEANAHGGPKAAPPKPKSEPKAPLTGAAAAKVLVETKKKIETMTRWERPKPGTPSAKALASLERREERLLEVVDEKEALAMVLAPPPVREFVPRDTIRFAPLRTYPAGQMPPLFDTGGIPPFLLRKVTK